MMIIACHNGTFCFTNSAYLRSPPLAPYKLLSLTKLTLAPVIHGFSFSHPLRSRYVSICRYCFLQEDFVSPEGDAFYKQIYLKMKVATGLRLSIYGVNTLLLGESR